MPLVGQQAKIFLALHTGSEFRWCTAKDRRCRLLKTVKGLFYLTNSVSGDRFMLLVDSILIKVGTLKVLKPGSYTCAFSRLPALLENY